MSLTVNSNLASLNAQNAISQNQQGLSTAMQRLSTGLKINSAADNAAGYAVSQRMTANINGITQAASNANDAISLTQTAQGDLGSITGNLQQIRTLAVQAANGSNSASDRAALNNQAQQLISEITRVASSSSFNGVNLLNGSFQAQNFQVGANSNAASTITIASIGNATASSLGVTASVKTGTVTGASSAAGGLAAGDLTLNGIQVGSSIIGANPGQSSNSAVQIAAAINLVSGQSGVIATANATTLTGSAATTFAAVVSGATLTVNGIQVGNVAAGVDAVGQGANVAAALNLVSSQSGVTASANASTGLVTLTAADGANIALGAGFTVGNSGLAGSAATVATGVTVGTPTIGVAAGTSGFTINGVQVGAVTAGGTAAIQATNVAAAINLVSSQSGVTASAATGVVVLTNSSNGGISMGSGFTVANSGLVAATNNVIGTATTSTISLSNTSGGTITVSGGVPATAGLTAGLQATTSSTSTLNNVSLNTAAGAQAALAVIDGALNQVNTSAASLGAYQNRFAQTVSSLNSQNVNNTASRSRIVDADFASETANLSRAQVLQQAGTAMLAQANQSAQGVLSLLR